MICSKILRCYNPICKWQWLLNRVATRYLWRMASSNLNPTQFFGTFLQCGAQLQYKLVYKHHTWYIVNIIWLWLYTYPASPKTIYFIVVPRKTILCEWKWRPSSVTPSPILGEARHKAALLFHSIAKHHHIPLNHAVGLLDSTLVCRAYWDIPRK
jgi:hypothetical protein